MKNSLFIHIGMPKTGSSAIQAFLTLNYNKLLKKGVLFPHPPNLNQAFQTSAGNVSDFFHLFANQNVEEIKTFIQSLGHNSAIILSSEALIHTLKMYPERFFEVFNNYNYKIICYVRRQDNLISSWYNQAIKNHNATSRAEIGHIEKTHDFCEALLDSLNYTEASNFIIRPYEKQQFYGGNIYADFLNCIGLELDDDYIFPEKIVNPSFDWDVLEFRRILNILEVDRNINKDKYYINSFLAKYTVDKNMGKPFQDSNIFSPKERIEIMNRYKEKNEQVAKVFLNRTDGKLFYDPIPEIESTWQQKEELTLEKALDICKFILKTKYQDNLEEELIKIIAKGTVDRILDMNRSINKDIPLLYTLQKKPTVLSKDILNLERKFDFWYIESNGNDPYFTIPDFKNKGNATEIFLKIDVTTSSETVLQLYYLSDNDRFDEGHSISRNLKKGYNEIIIKIKEKQPIRSLRLDPGNVKGMYLLHTFEVRGEKNSN
jgi:hypothetical protein